MQNSFLFLFSFFLVMGLGRKGCDEHWCKTGAGRGQSHPGNPCSVLLPYSFLSAPSLIYSIVPNLYVGWVTDRFPRLDVG